MVPAQGLPALCEAAGPDASRAFGEAIGTSMGRRMRVRLHKLLRVEEHRERGDFMAPDSGERQAATRELSLEQAVEQLAIEFALIGMGALSAERWGRALLMLIDQAPVASPSGELGGAEDLCAAVLSGALSVATAMAVKAVPIERDGVRVRYLIVSPTTAKKVRQRLAAGDRWGNLLVEMHGAAK